MITKLTEALRMPVPSGFKFFHRLNPNKLKILATARFTYQTLAEYYQQTVMEWPCPFPTQPPHYGHRGLPKTTILSSHAP